MTILLDGKPVVTVTDPSLSSAASIGAILRAIGTAIEDLALSNLSATRRVAMQADHGRAS